MQTKRLGNTDLELTRIGLGAWAMGGPWLFGWGPQDDADSITTIAEALDAGINWIDTAPIYGYGRSEEVVGRALKQISQKPIIATKCGVRWDDTRDRFGILKKQSIIQECENSLKRLGVDTIDLYQMHWNDPNEDIEEGFAAMAQCVKDGKVRYIGVSNYRIADLERIKDIHPIASLQPPYNMIRRECESELLGYCAQNHIGVVVYSPMNRGLLTGAFTKERLQNLPDGDHRKKSDDFKDPALSATLELVDALRPLAQAKGITLSQLAIAWTLRRTEVTAAIVGARKPNQIRETAPAAHITLTPTELNTIDTLLNTRQRKLISTK
ncbi:MAG: aldo/keto reductase [Sedimentisphaerales bacterium]|nr:aldo/keto reductase [Sedimentisphaerales bacterium]